MKYAFSLIPLSCLFSACAYAKEAPAKSPSDEQVTLYVRKEKDILASGGSTCSGQEWNAQLAARTRAAYDDRMDLLADDPRPLTNPAHLAAQREHTAANNEIEPIGFPIPHYPVRMSEGGIEGYCVVRFDVSTTGRAFNVTPACSNPGFERNAQIAVEKSGFIPKRNNGSAMVQQNIIYPIKFCLENWPAE